MVVVALAAAVLAALVLCGVAGAAHNPNPKLAVTFSGTWKVSHVDGSGASFQNISGKWKFSWSPLLHDFRDFGKQGAGQPHYFPATHVSGSGKGTFQDYGGATCHTKIEPPDNAAVFQLVLVKRAGDAITVQAAAPFGGVNGSVGGHFAVTPDTCNTAAGMIFQSGTATRDWTPRVSIAKPTGSTESANEWQMEIHSSSAIFRVNAVAPEKSYPVSFSYSAHTGSGDNISRTTESWSGTVKIAVAG
ncbi:MAG TPA: hypothetical protein VHB30_10480 [Solirubrobacteraceae bacterium]|nr:hypothetical protein [Solirubrobacteraceae bacterium]